MLYVANALGTAIAVNLKLTSLLDKWMHVRMPDRGEGERIWLQVRSAHYTPKGIGFKAEELFTFLKNVCSSTDAKSFFFSDEHLIQNVLLANLLCSLIELRHCNQDQACVDAIMKREEYFLFDVWPAWGLLTSGQFSTLTSEVFGDSTGVINFVFPDGTVALEKFWPLWKRWKEHCLNLWWQRSHDHRFLSKKPRMLLPGEPPND